MGRKGGKRARPGTPGIISPRRKRSCRSSAASNAAADESDEECAPSTVTKRRVRVRLSSTTKAKIMRAVAIHDATGKPRGGMKKIQEQFGLHDAHTARKIANGEIKIETDYSKGGRPRTLTDDDMAFIDSVLKENKYDMTWQALSETLAKASPPLKTSPMTLWRECVIRRGYRQCSKRIKPLLSETQRKARLKWAKKYLREDWSCVVDIDEKWFYTFNKRGKLKVPPGHKPPKQAFSSKRFIPKIMFHTALAKPNAAKGFDGLVFIEAYLKDKAAVRRSRNRAAGTIERKPYNISGKTYAAMMKKTIKAIRKKMWWMKTVYIQDDNATPHRSAAYTKAIGAACEPIKRRRGERKQKGDGMTIILRGRDGQCPQSPDQNANDLAFYTSLDASLPKPRERDIATFEQQVLAGFAAYDTERLTKIFELKGRIPGMIKEAKGWNDYDMHRKK